MTPSLSKSRFQHGLQCLKRLYLESYRRDLADTVSAGQQAIFDSGTAVGELARQRFPRGILVDESHLDHQRAVETTRALVDDSSVSSIYEAGFTFEGIRTRIDVLERNEDGIFDLIEVKSTASVKPEHYTDVAIQLYVVEGSGFPVNRASLMHLNRDYVYQGGEHSLQELFALEDVTTAARSFVDNAAVNKLNEMWSVLEMEDEPDIGVGSHVAAGPTCVRSLSTAIAIWWWTTGGLMSTTALPPLSRKYNFLPRFLISRPSIRPSRYTREPGPTRRYHSSGPCISWIPRDRWSTARS